MFFGTPWFEAMNHPVRPARPLNFILVSVVMLLTIMSCTDGKSSDGNNQNQNPTNAEPKKPSDLSEENRDSDIFKRSLELKDLTFVSASNFLNWPAVPMNNEYRGESAPDSIVGYRFKTNKTADIEILAYLTSFRCQSNGSGSVKPDFALYELTENERLKTRIDSLEANSKIKIEPGMYAVTISFAPNARCQNVAIGFEASLKISSNNQGPTPAPVPSPTPKPSRTPSPLPNPTPSPFPNPTPTPTAPALGAWHELGRDFVIGLSSIVKDLPTSSTTQPAARCGFVSSATPWDLASSSEITVARVLPLSAGSIASVEFATLVRGGEPSPIVALGSMTFFKQDGYPEDWIELLQQDILGNMAPVLRVTNSPACVQASNGKRWLIGTANIPALWPDVSSWGASNAQRFPLKNVTLSSGNIAPDLQITYAYDAKDNGSSWLMSLGVDKEKMNELLARNNLSDFSNLAWIVMERSQNLPQSVWTYISRGELMGDSNGRLLIKAGQDVREVTRALLNQPTSRSVVLRISKKETWGDGSGVRSHQSSYFDLVIDHGLLCQLSYSRPDGAVWHEHIFKDLTHPEWNNSPSKSNKTGCAFAGVPLP